MQFGVNVNGPQGDLWPDYTDPFGGAGEPIVGRGRAWARGDVAMRGIDGIHSDAGCDFTKDYDDAAAETKDWRRNVFLPQTDDENGASQTVYVVTAGFAQDAEGRGFRVGRGYVKCNLASTTVTAGMKFKLTDAQVYLSPAEAGSSGAARIVAKATKRQTFSATGVQLVEVYFVGEGPGLGPRFT